MNEAVNRICENPTTGRKLALSGNGDLSVCRDGQWERLGDDARFEGELTPCAFQDILCARGSFYVAGTTPSGQAALYSSLEGEIWSPVSLMEQHFWADGNPPRGGAVKLFFEPCMSQILLVCSGGDVVIIPECPKCIKILRLTDRTVVDADYSDHRMTLAYGDGQRETVSIVTADAIRVSLSYAKQTGGKLIDIRPEKIRLQEGPIPCSAAIDPEDLDDYLKTKPLDARLYFMCSFGTIADQAAWHAYYAGFQNARSVGGCHRGMHIK